MRASVLVVQMVIVCATLRGQEIIIRPDVERIVRTLAADSMEGRASFTRGNGRAAAFLQDEFRKIGLETWNGDKDFRQAFPVYSTTSSHIDCEVNGAPIDTENIAVQSSGSRLNWTENDTVQRVYIFEGDDFSQKFNEILRGHEDALVMIDSSHRSSFQKYRRYIASRHLFLDAADEPTIVGVLNRAAEPHRFSIHVENTVEQDTLINIVGMIRGRSSGIVIFSAHYDHLGILPAVRGDSIANGADDDASGVAAVTSLAKYFASQGRPERTLLFIAFAAEEIGGYGSQFLARHVDADSVVAMFNIEMVGTPSKFGPNTFWMTGYDLSSLGRIVRKNLEGTPYQMYPDPYPKQNLFYRSDNAKFARLGVPAHSFSSVRIDVDELYHSVRDEASTLDFENLTGIVRALARGASTIVSGLDTPTRIDSPQLRR